MSRFDSEEVNPSANPATATSKLSPVPPEPYDRGATIDSPLNDGKDVKAKEKELLAKEQVVQDLKWKEDAIARGLFQDVQQTNTNSQKGPKNVNWRVKEDVALMSSWCIASEAKMRVKNQRGASLWARVLRMFNEIRAEKPEEIGERNMESIKGRWKRLNENANKWIAAYKEAYGRKKSGMSLKDVEKEAHSIYEVGGNKYNDLFVFNEVMSKHPKWKLKLDHDSTRFRPENEERNEESGGSSKRPRTSEDVEYSIPSHPGRDAAKKKKGKGVTSQSSSSNEVAAEIRALRLTRDIEVKVMSKLGRARIELELKKEQRKAMKMNQVILNTLLAKNHLLPEDEEMKRYLMSVVFEK